MFGMKPQTATVLQFPRPQRRSLATLDRAWRELCCDYLFACFNNAPAKRLQELAGRIYFARKALQRRRAPRMGRHHEPVAAPRLAVDSHQSLLSRQSTLSDLSPVASRLCCTRYGVGLRQ